jgi:peroxiredoxin
VVADIEKAGGALVVLSPQLAKYSKQVAKKNQLTYSVLADPGNQVAAQFGLFHTLPDNLRELYTKFGLDLERFNGDSAWQLPLPGRFILDRQGTVIHRNVHPDYTKRPEPAEIVNILASMG